MRLPENLGHRPAVGRGAAEVGFDVTLDDGEVGHEAKNRDAEKDGKEDYRVETTGRRLGRGEEDRRCFKPYLKPCLLSSLYMINILALYLTRDITGYL